MLSLPASTNGSKIKFSVCLQQTIQETLKKFTCREFTPSVLRMIYDAIKDDVKESLVTYDTKLSDDSITWITHQYFKVIKIDSTDNQIINDLVVLHEIKLPELPYEDIRKLFWLFEKTNLRNVIKEDLLSRPEQQQL